MMQRTDDEITIFLAKANQSLLTAEITYANAHYDSCANRCYYACFQAAIAALLREGIRPRGQWSHDFVQTQPAGLLANRRKRYHSELRRVLSDNQSLRDRADYRPEFVTQTQANRALSRSRTFVVAIQQGGNRLR